MHRVKGMVCDVVEWDGTKELVRVVDLDSFTEGFLWIEYEYHDGTTHRVSSDYFREIYRGAGSWRGWEERTSPKICEVRVQAAQEPHEIRVVLTDKSEHHLGSFFSDELSFVNEEFVGLSLEAARALLVHRDVEYLRR